MNVQSQVTINAPKAAVWQVITDIENAAATISGIEALEVLEKPEQGLVGLKWRETRTLFGKTATEVMWMTEAEQGAFYKAQAESHGCVYLSTMSIAGEDGNCTLTMTHETKPQTVMAKLMSPLMGLMFKGTLEKVILQDLNDIKGAVEMQPGDQ